MFTAYKDGKEVAERDFMEDLQKDLRDMRMTDLQSISFLSDSNYTFDITARDLAQLNAWLAYHAADAELDDADCYTRTGEDAMTAAKALREDGML